MTPIVLMPPRGRRAHPYYDNAIEVNVEPAIMAYASAMAQSGTASRSALLATAAQTGLALNRLARDNRKFVE